MVTAFWPFQVISTIIFATIFLEYTILLSDVLGGLLVLGGLFLVLGGNFLAEKRLRESQLHLLGVDNEMTFNKSTLSVGVSNLDLEPQDGIHENAENDQNEIELEHDRDEHENEHDKLIV